MGSHQADRPMRSRSTLVVLLQAASLILHAAFASGQGLLPCPSENQVLVVNNTSDATNLANSLQCSRGSFSVMWYGDVHVLQTINITQGTSLNVTGGGDDAIANGNQATQLFAVDGAFSALYLTNMILANGKAEFGGAVMALNQANISFDGRMFFDSNTAQNGGAIYVGGANAVWDGQVAQFRNNNASGDGGALLASGRSILTWRGDTLFTSTHAGRGGAVLVREDSNVSWKGTTQFIDNSATDDGGGLAVEYACVVAWSGNTTFENNIAGGVGGGIHVATDNVVSWTGATLFIGNVAGDKAGALFVSKSVVSWAGDTEFTDNEAHRHGGAIYAIVSSHITCQGTTVFLRNSATTGEGGALALYGSWSGESSRINITGEATFMDNFAFATGGAIFSSANAQGHYFENVTFQTNSAGIGGAVGNFDNGNDKQVLPAPTVYSKCQFVKNLAASSGLAVAVFDSLVNISETSFNGNAFSCPEGEYLQEALKEASGNDRYDKVCDGCPSWEECQGCTVSESNFDPVCSITPEHTSANETGTTLETLSIDQGYWRATNGSSTILACYNADACLGGQTGTDSFCDKGYMGPYCSVCQPGFSSTLSRTCSRCSESRFRVFVYTVVIGGIVGFWVIVAIGVYLVSSNSEERKATFINNWNVRGLPLQGFKSVIVVFQILTQFASVTDVIYPGVYQTFLSGIDTINLDTGIVASAGCLWSDIDFHDRLLVGTMCPVVVLGLLWMTYQTALHRSSECGDSVREKIRNRHISAVMFVLFFVYSSVSSIVFQMFACDALDDDKEYLRADYRILCTDEKHKHLQMYAVFMIAVYPVGIPLLFAVLLRRYRDVLSDPGSNKADVQSMASLWEPYRPSRFYYEIVEYGRRIMLTGVVVFIYPNDTAQIAITIISTFLFFMVSEVLSPYESASDTWLSRTGHVLIFFSMFDVLLLRVDVSQESSDSQQVLAGAFVTGHVLMIVAVLAGAISVCIASWRPVITVEEEGPSHTYLRRPPIRMEQEDTESEYDIQAFSRAKQTVELDSQ